MTTIREYRLARNWSQADLAAHSGLSVPAISRLERGQPITITTLKLVCQALEISREQVTGVNIHSAVQAAAERDARKRA